MCEPKTFDEHLEMAKRAAEPFLLPGKQVVSQAEACGEVRVVPSLEAIQGTEFPQQTIIVADRVGGNEDIPVTILP